MTLFSIYYLLIEAVDLTSRAFPDDINLIWPGLPKGTCITIIAVVFMPI